MPDIHVAVRRTTRLSDPPLEIDLRSPLCFSDKAAHAFIISLVNEDNSAASLTGLTVSGIFVRADNQDASLTGSVSGNETMVVLTDSCYRCKGPFTLTIKLMQGTSVMRTLAIVRGRTMADTGDAHLDPEHTMPSLPELIAQANAAVAAITAKGTEVLQSIPADYTALKTSLLLGIPNNTDVPTIANNTDFDTLQTPGTYKIISDASAQTMTHMPIQATGRLIVMYLYQSTRFLQIYCSLSASGLRIDMRTYAGSWGDWQTMATKDSIDHLSTSLLLGIPSNTDVPTIANNTDFDTLLTAGTYKVVSGASAITMAHMPIQESGRLIVMYLYQSTRVIQIYVVAKDVYMRSYDNVGWSNWRTIAKTEIADHLSELSRLSDRVRKNNLFDGIQFRGQVAPDTISVTPLYYSGVHVTGSIPCKTTSGTKITDSVIKLKANQKYTVYVKVDSPAFSGLGVVVRNANVNYYTYLKNSCYVFTSTSEQNNVYVALYNNTSENPVAIDNDIHIYLVEGECTDSEFASITGFAVYSNIAQMQAEFVESTGLCYVLSDDSLNYGEGFKGNFYQYSSSIRPKEPALDHGGCAKLIIPPFTPIKGSNAECIQTLIDIAESYMNKGVVYAADNGPFMPDSAKHAGIQCSQFMACMLLGLLYENSKLASESNTNELLPGGVSYIKKYFPGGVGDMGANDLARLAATHGWLQKTNKFSDCEPGDVVFFYYHDGGARDSVYWEAISHTAMVITKKDGHVVLVEAGGHVRFVEANKFKYYYPYTQNDVVHYTIFWNQDEAFGDEVYGLFGFARFPINYSVWSQNIRINNQDYPIQDTAGSALTAPTEVTSTASAAHATGGHFIYNGVLYVATTDIAPGATITPNTNCRAVRGGIGGEVSALKGAIEDLEASSEPHNYALDGKNLKDTFADADALCAALEQEDYTNIRIGDYWPVPLNGDYWDYGYNTLPAGATYYSDTACETEAGTTENAIVTSAINDTDIPGGAKPYCEFKISGVTYYCKLTDTLPYAVKTLSNALMVFEAQPNVYWRYGDSGSLNFHNGRPHILFSARDGLPHTLKMRKGNEIWEGTNIAEFTGDGTTTEFTIDGTVGTIGYVFVDGARKTYNTDYTFSGNKITFKAGKQPASGALLQVEWMAARTPWTGSAIYRTFNDPDHGIIKLIQQADPKLYAHIYQGPNGKGMRYYGETRTKTNQQNVTWEDRGLLFLPTEDEVWGRVMHSGTQAAAQMQQWPIYQLGGRRHFAKGAGNAASRYHVWCASSTSVLYFAYVNNSGNPSIGAASSTYAASPGFIFTKPTT